MSALEAHALEAHALEAHALEAHAIQNNIIFIWIDSFHVLQTFKLIESSPKLNIV